jgi:hypothetical protein
VRLGEAYLPIHVVSPCGSVDVPQLLFSAEASRLEYEVRYHPTVLLTYRVDYESDERSENIVRLCYDAFEGAPRHDLVARLHDSFYIGGEPPGPRTACRCDLSSILEAGRAEVEGRVASDVKVLGQKLSILLEEEKGKLEKHFRSEMESARDAVTRQQLSDTLGKKVEELERQFACRINIKLLSALRLWWPYVDYRMTFASSRGDFVISSMSYSLQSERTEFIRCLRCGNHITYDVCRAAKHVVCAGECRTDLGECATCEDDYCPEHGGNCRDCSRGVCQHDRQSCGYGKHSPGDYFCGPCLLRSFEGRPICRDCREACDICGRLFPLALVAFCRVGNEQVCWNHGSDPHGMVCAECDEVACADHSLVTADKTWVCQDHVGVSSCCGRTFGLSRLTACCVDPGEALCPSHQVKCLGCGGVGCEHHTSALVEHAGAVCDNCLRTCSECPPVKSYIESDLTRCATGGELLCRVHRVTCVVSRETVCPDHTLFSVDGEPLCRHHAGACVQCGPAPAGGQLIHRSDSLQSCAVCRQGVCAEHREVCPTCRVRQMCFAHHHTQPACAGCGKVSCGSGSCSAASGTCSSCGMNYCRHCCITGQACKTCQNLRQVPLEGRLTALLSKASSAATKDVELVNSVTGARPDKLTAYIAVNQTFEIVLVDYQPGIMKFWQSALRLQLVATRGGQIKGISVTPINKV